MIADIAGPPEQAWGRTGRYEGLPVENKICFYCSNCVEDELHVITKCPLYADFRDISYTYCTFYDPDSEIMSNTDKMCFILSNPNVSHVSSRILHLILKRRINTLYHDA